MMQSSKAYTGVIKAYGQAAMYEEALVMFNTMNEMGSKPTIETYNTLIYMFSRGGLYKKTKAILLKMGESEVARDRDSFNGVIEGYRPDGQFKKLLRLMLRWKREDLVLMSRHLRLSKVFTALQVE